MRNALPCNSFVGLTRTPIKKTDANPKGTRGEKTVPRSNVDTHIRCWRKYKVRPSGGSPAPQETNWNYCIYDKMHNDYGYTQAWVDFLIEKLKDPTEFDSLSAVPGRAGESAEAKQGTQA